MRTPTTQLGTVIRRRRKALRWTQSRLASEVGRTLQWVSQIETGTRLTSDDAALDVARALDLPPDELSRLLHADRAAQGGGPPPAAHLPDVIAAWRREASEQTGMRSWAMWITGRGFPAVQAQDDGITMALLQCAAAGLDIVYCPIAAAIGARTDAVSHAPWMAASTLQGSLDVVLHGATADETRQHMWLLAESAVGEPTSAAIFAEYAQVLLLLRSPQPAENEEATPPPINGDGVDVTDAWLRLQTITPSGEAWLWIRMGGDRGQQTYGIRHWLEAMQARRMLRIGPLFEWRPTPMGTEA